MDPHLSVGIDIGHRNHRVGIAAPNGAILDEFDISHTAADFQETDGAEIGGVRVYVSNGSGDDKGQLKLFGTMKQFRFGREESWCSLVIGGQKLWIDHVCPYEPNMSNQF